jgi:4-hydroxy-tetrahydrodipicolinate synthase
MPGLKPTAKRWRDVIKLKKNFLRGSYPPIITPFKANGAVDIASLRRCVDFSIRNGSHGILLSGTTSEPSSMTIEERITVYKEGIDVGRGRVPMVCATGSQSESETMALSEAAEKAGADALLIVTPYYIRPPQRGLARYYINLCKRTSLPVMIYHIPGRAAVNVTMKTLRVITSEVENMVGMKHAFNDLGFCTNMIREFGPDWRVFVGLEDLSFPMLCVGACGLMNAVGNLHPKKLSQMCEAVDAGNLKRAKALHYELAELNEAVFYDTNPIPIKYMMWKMGLIAKNHHRLPMAPAGPEVGKRLNGVMKRAGLKRVSARKPAKRKPATKSKARAKK